MDTEPDFLVTWTPYPMPPRPEPAWERPLQSITEPEWEKLRQDAAKSSALMQTPVNVNPPSWPKVPRPWHINNGGCERP